jgi:hypothetical protein
LGNSLGNITCLEDFGVFLAFLTKRQKWRICAIYGIPLKKWKSRSHRGNLAIEGFFSHSDGSDLPPLLGLIFSRFTRISQAKRQNSNISEKTGKNPLEYLFVTSSLALLEGKAKRQPHPTPQHMQLLNVTT